MKRLKPLKASVNTSWIWANPAWPAFVWDEAALSSQLASTRRLQGELIGAAGTLDVDSQTRAAADLLLQDALNTCFIEGEHPDPAGVRSSIARRLGLVFAGLPTPDRAVDGLVEVLLDATSRYNQPLTLDRLCAWQSALFPDGRSLLHKIRVGTLRGDEPMRIVSGPIGRERVHYEAVPCARLVSEMTSLLAWFSATPPDVDGLLRAGIAHLWFELIHPFEDGNGRVGRALMDMALAQDEGRGQRLYSLSAQFMSDRSRYYELLEAAGRGSLDITEWLAWFLQQIESACVAAQRTLANMLAKARFWMRHSEAPLSERQRKILNRLLDAGFGFDGGMTTRKYVNLTGVRRATAFRELSQLQSLGCVVANDKGGRSSGYEIPWAAILPALPAPAEQQE